MNYIERFKKLGIYYPNLCPVKIYCSNFSRRKLGIFWCSKEVFKFLVKYIPEDMIWDIGFDKDNVAYINFVNARRLKYLFRELDKKC